MAVLRDTTTSFYPYYTLYTLRYPWLGGEVCILGETHSTGTLRGLRAYSMISTTFSLRYFILSAL